MHDLSLYYGGKKKLLLNKYSDNIMIYHYITGGRRNSYLIKYSDNIMIYHYITGEEEILTQLNILIIS